MRENTELQKKGPGDIGNHEEQVRSYGRITNWKISDEKGADHSVRMAL